MTGWNGGISTSGSNFLLGYQDHRDIKPKLEAKKRWKPGGQKAPRRQVSTPFKAPTSGLENVMFKMGHLTDAADFEEHKKALAQYCTVNFKDGGALVQKAIDDMETPVLTPPIDPPDTVTSIEIKKWERTYDAYDKKQRAWEDGSTRAFQLLMQHCHPDVEQQIKSNEAWEVTNAAHNPVKLMKLIRSAVHKHDEIKQGAMVFVEQDIRLYTMRQDGNTTPLDFDKLVKAQADVINVQGDRAGYHHGL
eukprot:CCRYP_006458-RA/>CCRYP_006458-RA protein AED:0.52 eAED:0.43 QI:0/0/0/0.5/1/1/2/0/247